LELFFLFKGNNFTILIYEWQFLILLMFNKNIRI
jgi:hypothetical protein